MQIVHTSEGKSDMMTSGSCPLAILTNAQMGIIIKSSAQIYWAIQTKGSKNT